MVRNPKTVSYDIAMTHTQSTQGRPSSLHSLMRLIPLLLALHAQCEESDYYQIDTFPTEALPMEVGAMTLLGDGNLLVGTRRGDVYVLENPYGAPEAAQFRPWARGLAQPLGFLEHQGWIYTAQRGELTRMKDADGDGAADTFETVCDAWDISGNYHEYNFGPRMDKEGFMWITLNKPFGGQPYADPEIKQAHWRGWAVRVNPDTGEMFPMAAGLRSPAGVEDSPWGYFLHGQPRGMVQRFEVISPGIWRLSRSSLGPAHSEAGWRTLRRYPATGFGHLDERHAPSDPAIQNACGLVPLRQDGQEPKRIALGPE